MTDLKIMKTKFWMDVYLIAIKEHGTNRAVQIADDAIKRLEERIGAET